MSLSARWNRELDELGAQGRLRRLQAPRGHDFSSNDYLGYGAVAAAERVALPRSGMASRLLRGHHPMWDEVEARLARWHGAESALVFSSGYAANEGLLATLLAPGDWVASDQLNHASIIDGLRLGRAERFIYRHADANHVEEALKQARVGQGGERFIVTESLFGMEGNVAPLVDLADVARRHGAHLIVDEAHATGCFGATGAGLVEQLGLRERVLATVHTGGKALGTLGAYVAVPRALRDYLVNRCRHLIFTTALPPQVAAWWLETLDRVPGDETARAGLHDRAYGFRDRLRRHGIEAAGGHYVVPILLGADTRAVAVAASLQRRGFDVRAIRPPTVPPGTARLRISLHADHPHALLDELAAALVASLAECPS